MAKRKIVHIDEARCNGCGECVPSCAEGAIEIVEGKARLVSDVYCDGLGACLGHCPQDAIRIVEAEARPFDEAAVAARLRAKAARSTALPSHPGAAPSAPPAGGCPGSASRAVASESGSALTNWPVQLRLISPQAPHFAGSDLLLVADCVPAASPELHSRFLPGHTLAIACPKLDDDLEAYVDKLVELIDDAGIASLTVLVMQVPCCRGLLGIAQAAVERAHRKPPVRALTIGVQGEVLADSAQRESAAS